VKMDEELALAVQQFLTWLDGPFGAAFAQLDGPDLRLQTEQRDRPVAGVQQRLQDAQRKVVNGQRADALNDVRWAANIALDGAGYPDPKEFRGKNVSIARAHACLWRGISCGLLGDIEKQLMNWDLMACDMWFGQAAWGFLNNGETAHGARALAEWSEARMAVGDWDSAHMFGTAAMALFVSVDEHQSSVAVAGRLAKNGPSDLDSAVLFGRTPSQSELVGLVTVLGGKNAYHLRANIMAV
jgi:hypothetical protein